jgi:ubiquinone/menaquinone biosynthesis C-methylase UbiE
LQISLVRARAQQLPFRTACVASIAIGGSLNEIGDLEGCLTETRRVLAPGAVFAAMTLTRHARLFESAIQRLMEPGGVRFWTADELIGRFEAHGLHVIRREQHGIVLFTQAVPR